jgi:hypothetical protein
MVAAWEQAVNDNTVANTKNLVLNADKLALLNARQQPRPSRDKQFLLTSITRLPGADKHLVNSHQAA